MHVHCQTQVPVGGHLQRILFSDDSYFNNCDQTQGQIELIQSAGP